MVGRLPVTGALKLDRMALRRAARGEQELASGLSRDRLVESRMMKAASDERKIPQRTVGRRVDAEELRRT